jgi:hypothetical protein
MMQKRQRSSVVHVTTEDLAQREIPHITNQIAAEARDLIIQQMREGKISRERIDAARTLAQLFNTQNRLSPERVKHLATSTSQPSADVRSLANLTVDELNALTEQMLGQTG